MKDKSKKSSSKIDPTIVVAIIAALATITVTLITVYGEQKVPSPLTPTVTETIALTFTDTPVPTNTVPPGAPTSTPMLATDTPIPTSTQVPPIALGDDWHVGCISTLWKPYPSDIPVKDRGDGCWQEPVYVFSAENGDLDFLAEHSAPVEIYGLFAPLPDRGTVTFTVRLKELRKADLWMGVFAEADLDSDGLLMIIPTGEVKKRVFVQKDPHNYETLASTSMLEQLNGFSVSFSFTPNSARFTINPSVFVTTSISIPSSQKWLFLGYKGLGGSYRVEGRFLSFELK